MVALDEPPPRPRIEDGDAARLESVADLSDACLKVDDNMLYGVYQDWVHPNPVNRLDVRIKEDNKWQARWENPVCFPTQCYDAPSGKFGRNFVATLSVELDVIGAWKWNAEQVIIFQLVIL